MLGGIAMLAVMAVLSVLDRRPWWTFPNLLGSLFYGWRAQSWGPGWATVSGAALQLVVAALAGMIFALLFAGINGAARRALIGILWGLLLFYASARIYSNFAPLVAAHLQRGAMMSVHIIYGAFLAGAWTRTAPGGAGGEGTPVNVAHDGAVPVEDEPARDRVEESSR